MIFPNSAAHLTFSTLKNHQILQNFWRKWRKDYYLHGRIWNQKLFTVQKLIFCQKYTLDFIFFSDGSDYKATLSDVIYRCKLDEENFADFAIEIAPGPEFRVEKFPKSIYVVEQEDLKVECDIVKQNNSEIGNMPQKCRPSSR